MNTRRIHSVLFICFFLSGIAGLIYEVVWAKYLSLIFGSSTYAHTLVLATFMGGLALGSFLLGRWSDAIESRLTLFAWVEIGIALFCIFTPRMFAVSQDVYLSAARAFSVDAAGVTALKFVIGALILLPPTVLMGGTLPILGKFMIRSLAVRGETVARLYYINSFGAVIGTILAGFYLVHHFGLEASITIAALLNLAIGVTVILLKSRYETQADSSPVPAEGPDGAAAGAPDEVTYSDALVKLALVGICVSGFAAMLYEVVWIRLLSTILGSSTYSFSLMLAAFISGITIGAFLISRFMPRPRHTFLAFGLCEAFIGLSLMCSLPFYETLPAAFLAVSGIFARTPETFFLYSTSKFFLAFIVMLPPTVFLGMTLPLVSRIASRKLEVMGRKIGNVFAFNTSGNIAGALVTGLVLLPFLGLKRTLELGIAINILLGGVIVSADVRISRRAKISIVSACCIAFVAYKAVFPDWNRVVFNTQLFRHGGTPIGFEEFVKGRGLRNADVLFDKDGLDATVSVLRFKPEGQLTLFINGKADASTGKDMPTQILCAQLPLLLRPDIQDVLVIGLGSGVTCGSALLHPIEKLDLIEIAPSVVEACTYFEAYNNDPLHDERCRVFVEDARTFMQRSEEKYDLIINEPSNPWMSGVGSLFTREYFEDCSRRLREGGLMIQWVQAYEMDEEIFEMILRTFCSVFPEVIMWGTGIYDTLLIGSDKKITPDLDASAARMADGSIQEDLSRVGINDLFTVLSLQLSSDETIRSAANMGAAVNSDYFPILEYRAPLALYTRSVVKGLIRDLDERRMSPERSDLFVEAYVTKNGLTHEGMKNLFAYISKQSTYNQDLLFALTKKWHETYPGDRDAVFAYTVYNTDSLQNAIADLEALLEEEPSPEVLDRYASFLVQRHNLLSSFVLPGVFTETVTKLTRCIALSPDKKARFHYVLGKVYAGNRDFNEAVRHFEEAARLIASKRETYVPQELDYDLIMNEVAYTLLIAGDTARSYEYALKILAGDPQNAFARSILRIIRAQAQAEKSKR